MLRLEVEVGIPGSCVTGIYTGSRVVKRVLLFFVSPNLPFPFFAEEEENIPVKFPASLVLPGFT